MMNVFKFKEAFHSVLSALQKYKKSSKSFKKCCSIKLLDSRDTDFNQIENRLAYLYTFGDSVISLVETCVLNFFKQCSVEEMIYFLKNGKICSLSNGPGLDIIGYICALIKSNEQLNCYPALKGINLYESWRDLFQTVTSIAHEKFSKSYLSCNQNPTENIQFIQCDIFSTLSAEARECIENSDILLMCKVFLSSKADAEIVAKTLKEILTLLKPGSIVFFIASRKNIKNVSTLSFLHEFVTIIYGPLKVTPENVPLYASVSETTCYKPEPPDKSYYMVMQKKFITIENKGLVTSHGLFGGTKKKSRRKKNKVLLTPSVSCDISKTDNSKIEDIDIDSSISVASSYKQSDITSDESKSVSYENVSQLGVASLKEFITADSINKLEQPEDSSHNSFQTKLQTFLDVNRISESSYNRKFKNSARNMSEVKANQYANKNVLVEIIKNDSNQNDSLNKIDSSDTLTKSVKKICNASAESKKPIKTEHININDPDSEIASIFSFPLPAKYIPSHKRSVEEMFSESEFHMEKIKPVNKTDCLVRKTSNGSGINSATRSRSLQEISTQIGKPKFFKKNTDYCEERKQETSSNCHKTLFRDSAISNASFCRKELKTETGQKETRKVFSENSFNSTDNDTFTKDVINTRNRDALHSMIEHCENLVTSLEGLVADVRKNVDSMNKQNSVKYCCKMESSTNCRHSCVCSNYCCEQSYLRRNCCCNKINNHVCVECTKSVCNRTRIHQMHDVENSRNSKQPYIFLPVQNEDIPFILNLVSKKS